MPVGYSQRGKARVWSCGELKYDSATEGNQYRICI